MFGYIHETEKELHLANTPMLIMYSCLAFSKDEDYFKTNIFHDNGLRFINRDKTAISDPKQAGSAISVDVYGHQSVDPWQDILAKWKIKINSCPTKAQLRIGIKDQNFVNCFIASSDGYMDRCYNDFHSQWREFKTGDILTFIMDLNNKQIKMQNNGKDVITVNILKGFTTHTKYRLFCNFDTNYDASVTIIDFCVE